MGGAAEYVADRLTEGKAVTQADVVDAVEQTIPSSKWKVKTYAQELHDVSEGLVNPRETGGPSVAAD